MKEDLRYTYWDRINKKLILYSLLAGFTAGILLTFPFWGFQKAIIFSGVIIASLVPIMFFFILLDFLSLSGMFKKYQHVDYGIKQFRELIIGLPISDTFENASKVIKSLKNIRNVEEHRNDWTIHAKTRMSWKSHGENITLRFSSVAPEKTLIHICSEPEMSFVVIDCGKNYENVEKIKAALVSAFARTAGL